MNEQFYEVSPISPFSTSPQSLYTSPSNPFHDQASSLVPASPPRKLAPATTLSLHEPQPSSATPAYNERSSWGRHKTTLSPSLLEQIGPLPAAKAFAQDIESNRQGWYRRQRMEGRIGSMIVIPIFVLLAVVSVIVVIAVVLRVRNPA